MRLPLSWLREHVALPPSLTSREIAAGLVRLGVEVEEIDEVGADLVGPLLVGRVLEVEEFTASNGKTIRWCQVDVGVGPARDHLRRAQLRRRRPGRGRAARRGAARWVRHHRPQDLRARVGRDDLLGPRARPRRRALRDHRAAAGAGPGRHRRDRAAAPARRRARPGDHVRPRLRDVGARHRAGALARLRRGIPGSGGRGDRGPAGRRRLAGADRGPGRLRPVLGPDGHRSRPGRGDPAGDPAPARAVRHPVDLARRRRHQLRDAGDRPADARVRSGPAHRPDHRAPGPAGGDAGDPGRGPAHARPGRPARDRRVRSDRAGRDHGRRRDRDRAGDHRRGAGGRALAAGDDLPRHPPAQAAQRGVQAVRARRRPAGGRSGAGPGLRAAGRARRGRRRPRGDGGRPGSGAGDRHAGRRPARAHGRHPDPGTGRAAAVGADRLRGHRGARRAVHGRRRRPGGTTWSTRPTWSRRSSGWRDTSRSRRCCRRRRRAPG